MLTLADYLDQQDIISLATRAHFRKNKKPGVNLIQQGI